MIILILALVNDIINIPLLFSYQGFYFSLALFYEHILKLSLCRYEINEEKCEKPQNCHVCFVLTSYLGYKEHVLSS